MDRRHFLAAASSGAALAGAAASAARAQPSTLPPVFGRSVADFGVRADTDADQSPPLEKALTEAAGTGNPLAFPPGSYTFKTPIRIAGTVAVHAPATANLLFTGQPPFLTVDGSLTLRSVILSAQRDKPDAANGVMPLIVVRGVADVDACRFISPSVAFSMVTDARGVEGMASSRFTHCRIASRSAYAVRIANGTGNPVILISGNQLTGCGLFVEGDSLVTGNAIANASDAGLRLGSAKRLGFITATNNAIHGSPVGIAISNAPNGYAMATINMIRGAKTGAIRAFDGDRYVGKDLVQSSSESFPYIAVGGNVSV